MKGVISLKNIVDVKWLDEHINDDNLVIIDCRFSLQDPTYGEKAFKEAHIPKAISVNLDKDLAGKSGEHGGRHPLPNMKEFIKFIESLGISNNTMILIYDDGDLAAPSRLWWMLKYIGLDNVYLLEGGIKSWIDYGGVITSQERKENGKGKIEANLREYMQCSIDHVKQALGNKDVVIIDSRARDRYLGVVEPMDKKAGHIPGAKNYDWTGNFKEGKVLSIGELEKRFEEIKNYDEVIVHCGSGVTGCANVLILEEIGIPSKLYVGSWSDWCSYEENPVVTEEE